jgi:hypothetical protein
MITLPDDLINQGGKPSPEKIELKPSRARDLRKSDQYMPDAALADAIRVALLIRKPLLEAMEY